MGVFLQTTMCRISGRNTAIQIKTGQVVKASLIFIALWQRPGRSIAVDPRKLGRKCERSVIND